MYTLGGDIKNEYEEKQTKKKTNRQTKTHQKKNIYMENQYL